jgi:hypothetical protein
METIIHNLFSTEAGVVWLVLKWMLVVLAAGFIGQFGKAFAKHLMQKAPERKGSGSPPAHRAEPQPPAEMEKSGPQVLPQSPAPATMDTAEQAGRREEEKKEMKAQAKQQKKALKSLKKFFK